MKSLPQILILLTVWLGLVGNTGPSQAAEPQADQPDTTAAVPPALAPPAEDVSHTQPTTTGADTTAASPANVEMQVGLTTAELLQPTISPTAAVLMTPVFPGWGQLYGRNSWRAALAFGVEMFYLSHMFMNELKADRTQAFSETLPDGSPQRDAYAAQAEEFRERVRDFGWWAFAGLLIIALDAYVGAHLFQFEEDAIPVPDKWPDPDELRSQSAYGLTLETTQVVFQWRLSF